MYTNCATLCSFATSYYDHSTGSPGAATSAAECAANPYAVKTFAPTPRPTPQPTPSPVADTGVPNCEDLCDAHYKGIYGAGTNRNPWCGSCNSGHNCFTTSCEGPYTANFCTVHRLGTVCTNN